MRKILIALTLAFTLSACLPVAEWGRDLLDTSDGATLIYVTQGLQFHPGESVALSTQLVATGESLMLLATPEGATCEVLAEATRIDCDLGDVMEAVTVNLSGFGVLANASYRRVGAPVPRLVFAQ